MAELQTPIITGSLVFGSGSQPNKGGAVFFDLENQNLCFSFSGLAFSAIANLNNIHRNTYGGAGNADGALIFGGCTAPSTAIGGSPYRYGHTEGYFTGSYDSNTWSAGGALITSRTNLAGAGTQDAGLAFGGQTPTVVSCTEEYTGATESWSAGGALITARLGLAGAGIQNAGLAFGGYSAPLTLACTEEYGGSSWTTGNPLITARRYLIGAGTQDAGLAAGGVSPTALTSVEEYDGASWSLGGEMPTHRANMSALGTQNAALAIGGYIAPNRLACVEYYDGSSWSAVGSLSDGRCVGAAAGTVNAGIFFSGVANPGYLSTSTEEYDGIGWIRGGSYGAGTCNLAGAGTKDAGLGFGGQAPGIVGSTYEYNCAATCTVPVWKSLANLNTAVQENSGFGTANEALSIGGTANPPTNTYLSCVEQFGTVGVDVAAWSAGGALPAAKARGAAAGVQDAAFYTGGSPVNTFTGEYDGSTWTTGGNLITGRCYMGSAGTLTAGLVFGGLPVVACTEEYDGATWATGGALIQARTGLAGFGTQTCAVAAGGCYTPAGYNDAALTEEYNGTTWSTSFGMTTGRIYLAGAGTQDCGIVFGGYSPAVPSPYVASCTEEYGPVGYLAYSWSESTNMINDRCCQPGAAGTVDSTLVFGGYSTSCNPSPYSSTCTEEWDGASWTAGGALITARCWVGGTGTQNAAIAVGPYPAQTEEYDGSTWASGGTRNHNVCCTTVVGVQNAGLAFLGGIFPYPAPSYARDCSESYDGTSWTAVSDLNCARTKASGAGTQNAAVAFGGWTQPSGAPTYATPCTEIYDGSTWSYTGGLITGRFALGGFGTQNAAFAAGGQDCVSPYYCSCGEEFNGLTWSVSSAVPTLRYNAGSTGNGSGVLLGGNYSNTCKSATVLTQTAALTDSVWSSGGALPEGVCGQMGAGNQSEALSFGGFTPSVTSNTRTYDGYVWKSAASLITGRGVGGGAGTQNAGLAIGGLTPSTVACTEEYTCSGQTTLSVWSNRASMVFPLRRDGTGTVNAGLAVGGWLSPSIQDAACTEEYDGSVWSTGGALITARCSLGVAGTQNAALAVTNNNAESYDGSVWSSAPSSGAGASSGNLVGGTSAATSVAGYIYNGSTWARVNCSPGSGCLAQGDTNNFIVMGTVGTPYTTSYAGEPGAACCCIL